MLLALLTACDDGADTGLEPPTGALVLDDAHNYTYSGTVTAEVFPAEPNADVCLDWSALATDLRGRAMTAADVEQVFLIRLGGTPTEVMEALASNTLTQSTVEDYRAFDNDAAASGACLSDFAILGNAFDPTTEFVCVEGSSWLVSLVTTSGDRMDFRGLAFLDPCAGGGDGTVTIDDTTASIDFVADLRSAAPLRAPAGVTGSLDWSALTTDAIGREIDPELFDRLLIGKIDAADVSEVERLFVRLDEEAAGIWRLDTYGTDHAELAGATDASGAAFPGFDTEGVWLVGLECLSCTSPAPAALAVVEVE